MSTDHTGAYPQFCSVSPVAKNSPLWLNSIVSMMSAEDNDTAICRGVGSANDVNTVCNLVSITTINTVIALPSM